MQKNPASSSTWIASDLPEPDMPVIRTTLIGRGEMGAWCFQSSSGVAGSESISDTDAGLVRHRRHRRGTGAARPPRSGLRADHLVLALD